jgi:hypothetical protein
MQLDRKQLASFLLQQFEEIGLDKKLGDIPINDVFVLAKHIEEYVAKQAAAPADEPPF